MKKKVCLVMLCVLVLGIALLTGCSVATDGTTVTSGYRLLDFDQDTRTEIAIVRLDSGGVGDRHIDLFWGIWTLFFNLKTSAYCQRYLDVYGRDRVSEDALRTIAAIEVFG